MVLPELWEFSPMGSPSCGCPTAAGKHGAVDKLCVYPNQNVSENSQELPLLPHLGFLRGEIFSCSIHLSRMERNSQRKLLMKISVVSLSICQHLPRSLLSAALPPHSCTAVFTAQASLLFQVFGNKGSPRLGFVLFWPAGLSHGGTAVSWGHRRIALVSKV